MGSGQFTRVLEGQTKDDAVTGGRGCRCTGHHVRSSELADIGHEDRIASDLSPALPGQLADGVEGFVDLADLGAGDAALAVAVGQQFQFFEIG